MVTTPARCRPSTMRRSPPTRCDQKTRSPASSANAAMAIQRAVNTAEKPRTNASACAIARGRVVSVPRAADPVRSARYAGTSGNTHGERNESTPAPNATATFT